MSDPRDKPPLAEDPAFLQSLPDLDRGLEPHDTDSAETPQRSADVVPISVATGRPTRRRVLMEIFPPSALVPEAPPGPHIGTAVGPDLPLRLLDQPGPARLAEAAPPVAHTSEGFYGLSEKPFDLSTDPKFFFHSQAHERILAALLTWTRQRDAMCLVTGRPGVGKTIVCRAAAAAIDRRVARSVILEPLADVDALVDRLIVDFGAMTREARARASSMARRDRDAALTAFFQSLPPHGVAVVMVDQADRQPPEVLEHLRALAAYGPSAGRLRIVLVALPTFAATLRSPALRTIDAAIAKRFELGPLAVDELGGYVRHRLGVAGQSPRVDIDEAALRRLFDLSVGVPAVVNVVCDAALAGGFDRSAATIDLDIVDAAARGLGLDQSAAADRRVLSGVFLGVAFCALVIAGAAAAAWVFGDALSRAIDGWVGVPTPPHAPARRLTAPLVPLPPPDNLVVPPPI